MKLTKNEQAAIDALEALAAKWPKTLWLFSADGSLNVMRCGPGGRRVVNRAGGIDQAYSLTSIDIPNDGGDW